MFSDIKRENASDEDWLASNVIEIGVTRAGTDGQGGTEKVRTGVWVGVGVSVCL